ncbi:MAG: class I SAM-dependent methyltransferase [Nitrospirota bacterium]
MQGQELRIIEPEVVLFAERRVEPRRLPTLDMTGVVEIGSDAANLMPVKRQLLEATDSGASFVVGSGADVPSPGDFLPALLVRTEKGVSSAQQASVVYASPFRSGDFRVGVQFHIDRCQLNVDVIDLQARRPLVPFTAPLIRSTRRVMETISKRLLKHTAVASGAHPVRYRTERGNEIAAYVNATGPWPPPQGVLHEAPVVIIPPAFARRKETTGLLARTLIETFRHQGRDLVVIRFDGISSVGESTNLADPGYCGEMGCYTLSQLADDIRETVRYATSTPFFSPQTITLVTFSMASIAARRFLAESENSTIRQWISCMGASDSDDLMRNSTGGIDYLVDFENGEHLGVKEVLGQLVDLDRFCRDVILNRMAYLQDARRDLARIATPVTWIYGKYDYWINRRRVLDIMSIRTSARRHVYEVPCGHIVRSGEDALDVFGLITSLIWTDHYGTQITPRIPSESERLEFERSEWGRVQQPHLDLRRYWRSYLLGSKPGEIGFDIITLTDEYLGLMDRQIELLDISPTDLVVDLGGGTGNFGLRYLERSSERGQRAIEGPRIVLIDFVRRALDAARNKHLRNTSVASEATFSYVEANLDLGVYSDRIPFKSGSVSKILASLFLSYVHEPELVLRECARLLRPGGLLVASTLLPDTDMSLPVHRLVEKIKAGSYLPYFTELDRDTILIALQSYINSAARLTDLEEQRLFRFFSESELRTFVEEAGFLVVDLCPTFGDPPQGVIIVGRRC